MVLKKENFNIPNKDWCNDSSTEFGDILIKIPELNFDEEGYVYIEEVGYLRHEEEGVHINHIEITEIKCVCNRREPLYFGCPDRKSYVYTVHFYLYEENNYVVKTLVVDSLKFFLTILVPHLNILIDSGHKIEDINWDWIEWQCSCWDFCMANDQPRGRQLNFYENDIRSQEDLYDALENIIVSGYEDGINHVGKDNDFWEVITVELKLNFPFVDRYIGEILFENPTYENEGNFIKYSYTTNYHSAYSAVGSYKLPDYKLLQYKQEQIRRLRINKVHLFNPQEMLLRRFLKS